MMSYQVLARKWRPHNFQQIVGQEHALRMLINALDNQRLHHAYLFTGTRGVGKTTLARLLAKCLNCETGITSNPCDQCSICLAVDAGKFLDLIEVDAASRTKVEDTRELLENVQYAPTQGRYKIYLIDEVHMLSGHSFNALLKTLEEPPAHVKFLLATTDPKRLPITILSRCLQFNLKRVPVDQIAQQLQKICTQENVNFEVPALELLAKAADGSMRDALSLMDQAIAYCREKVNTDDIRNMLGSIEQDAIFRLLTALANQDGKQLLAEITQLAESAPNFTQVMDEVLSVLHQISIMQVIPDAPAQHEQVKLLAAKFSKEDTQLYYQIALIGRRDLPLAPNPLQGFEITLLRMLAFKPAAMTTATQATTQTAKPQTTTKPTTVNAPAPVAEQQKAASPKAPVTPSNNWSEILPQLQLTGMAQALAANCNLTLLDDTQIELSLSKKHEVLLNKNLADRMEQTLNQYFGKPRKLSFKITDTELPTPQKQQQEHQDARTATAKDTITNDDHVKKMIDLFGAKLDAESIKAID